MVQEDFSYNKYTTVNKLDTDFRAEAVAAGFIESGEDTDKIWMVRKRGNKRHISKDISKIAKGFSSHDLMEHLYIYTNRESIYDTIPENIFHQPFSTGNRKTPSDVVKEIRRHRHEEEQARKFFQPFEMAIDQLLIEAQTYERKFDKKNFHSNLKDTLSSYWSLLRLFNLQQAVYFIRVIPFIHLLPASFEKTAKLMSIILDVPVQIEPGEVSVIQTNLSKKITPGKWKLGVNSVLGNNFCDGYRDIHITIGALSPEEIKSFSKGMKNDEILCQLIAMMLPAGTQRIVKFITHPTQARFRLSGGTHTAYLGINTRL